MVAKAETLDWRNLPPVPEEDQPDFPDGWTPSQTFLKRMDACDRAALLLLQHGGGAATHELNRGSIVHETADRLERILVKAQNERTEGVDNAAIPEYEVSVTEHAGYLADQLEDRIPPELGRTVLYEVMADNPQLQISAEERDACRYMVDHLCRGARFEPGKIIGIEKTLTLETGGFRVLIRPDLIEEPEPRVCRIRDWKTAWPPDSEEFRAQAYDAHGNPRWAGNYQLNMSAVVAAFGITDDGLPLGNFDRFILDLEYPRILRGDEIDRRRIEVDRLQVQSFRDDLDLQLRRLREVCIGKRKWQPTEGNHCFGGETRFLTDRGVRTLRDACGERLHVLNRHGKWETAEVRSFGDQPLVKVKFDDGSEVRATPDHRWWMLRQRDNRPDARNGWEQTHKRVTTMEVERVPVVLAPQVDLDPVGVRHGIVFGDGTMQKQNWTRVKLQPHKSELSRFFDSTPVSPYSRNVSFHPVKHRTDGTVDVTMQPRWFKKLPVAPTPEYARGFIAGLLATDGSVALNGGVTIYQEGREICERIAELARLGGCAVVSVKVTHRNTPAEIKGVAIKQRQRELTCVRISPATAPLIRSDQVARLKKRHQTRRLYRTVDVEDRGDREEVFCVVAPQSESFTLANGVATSNCRECPCEQQCPLPRVLRPESQLANLDSIEDLEKAATTWNFMSASSQRLKARLKKAAETFPDADLTLGTDENGEPILGVRIGKDLALVFTPTKTEKIADKENLRAAAEAAARLGEPFNWEDHVKRSQGVSFAKRKVQPQ